MKFSFFLIFTLLFSACRQEVTKKENELNIALASNISTLDPAQSYDTVSAQVVYQIYESLFEYDYLLRPYQLKPLLAQDFPSIDKQGKRYTIKIKKNIYYHPSKFFKGKKRELIAEDFINQFKRLAYPGTQGNGWWLFEGKIKGLDKFRKTAKKDFSDFFEYKISGLTAIDKYTLQIDLTQPYPQLMYALAMSFTVPIPQEAITFYKNRLSQNSVGTGPYILKKWQPGHSLELVKNQKYHTMKYPSQGDRFANEMKLLADAGKKLPFIDKIHFTIIKEAQTTWLNFLAKKLDLLTLTKDQFPLAININGKLKNELTKKNINLQIAPTLTYWWLSFNMKDKILGSNLDLRKAIAHAVDIKKYIQNFTNNTALQANSIYPPGVKGYSPSSKLKYEYNVKLAKEYLIKAGYKNGQGLPEFTYDARGTSTVSRQMGEFISNELLKVGIKVRVITNSFPAFLNKARTGQLQIWQGGWSMDYPHAENVVQLLISKNHSPGPNSSYYANPKVDKLYQELSITENDERVLEITKEVEDIVTDDLPWIMQFYSRNYILLQGNLKNYRQSDLINNNFKYLRIK